MLKQVARTIATDVDFYTSYTKMYNKENICGLGIWPGMEHNRGYHINPCWGGAFDLYKIPKYSFYFFKSQQDAEIGIDKIPCGPMLFIANYWTELSPDDVVVYSNCEEVRLYHNDELIGTQKPDDLPIPHPPFTFANVRRHKARDRSEVRAEGLIGGAVVAQDRRISPGMPKALTLHADFIGIPLRANGADLVMVYCDLVDDNGSLVPLHGSDLKIRFAVHGEGRIVGDESIGTNPIAPVMGRSGVLVQATQTAGQIVVEAAIERPPTSPLSISSATLSFCSKP